MKKPAFLLNKEGVFLGLSEAQLSLGQLFVALGLFVG